MKKTKVSVIMKQNQICIKTQRSAVHAINRTYKFLKRVAINLREALSREITTVKDKNTWGGNVAFSAAHFRLRAVGARYLVCNFTDFPRDA